MLRLFRFALAALAAASLAGCFTVGETLMPAANVSALPQCVSNRTVAVRGFEALQRDYLYVSGYQTGYTYGWGWDGWGWGHPGCATVYTTSVVPQDRITDRYLAQARDAFESAGFNICANPADYVVEVRFEGPDAEGAADGWRILGTVCSIFTYSSAAATWHARLKIHNNRTGKLVFSKVLDQRYEVGCFSPIPLLGISGYNRTDPGYMQSWCLTALTGRAVAEATAFLANPDPGR